MNAVEGYTMRAITNRMLVSMIWAPFHLIDSVYGRLSIIAMMLILAVSIGAHSTITSERASSILIQEKLDGITSMITATGDANLRGAMVIQTNQSVIQARQSSLQTQVEEVRVAVEELKRRCTQ